MSFSPPHQGNFSLKQERPIQKPIAINIELWKVEIALSLLCYQCQISHLPEVSRAIGEVSLFQLHPLRLIKGVARSPTLKFLKWFAPIGSASSVLLRKGVAPTFQSAAAGRVGDLAPSSPQVVVAKGEGIFLLPSPHGRQGEYSQLSYSYTLRANSLPTLSAW